MLRNPLLRILMTLAAALLFLSGAVLSASPARNLVIFIVDGMGPSHRQLGEISKRGGLEMNRMPDVGLMRTSSADLDLTDSAASATAMFCGRKTYNGMLGYDSDLEELTSVMELAEAKGMNTGIITTSALYDSTCAAMYASEFDRTAYKSISSQLLVSGIDLLMGGGGYFVKPPSGAGAKKPSYPASSFSYSLASFGQSQGLPAICLLAEYELPPEMDMEPGGVHLHEMVAAGLGALDRAGKPFLLLVESGAVDRMSHDNDAAGALRELLAADLAASVCLEFAEEHGDTLVLIAADHETGGLSLGSGAGYRVDVKYLTSVRASASSMAGKASLDWPSLPSVLKLGAGLEISGADAASIEGSADPAREVGKLVSARANIAWGTGWHTAVPVVVTAQGPGSRAFTGYFDNTEMYGKIRSALGL